MAYCLERDESMVAGIRRVASEQIESAVALIEDSGVSSEDAVHEVRKSCKRIRAALRLVRGGFKHYRQENERFRDLARAISDVRDLHALRESHRLLSGPLEDGAGHGGADDVPVILEAYIQGRLQARHQAVDESLAEVRQGLKDALEPVAAWEISVSDSAGPVGGLRDTYARTRKALDKCLEDPAASRLHEWRKQAKYHWHQLRLVSEAWPEAREHRGAAAEHLAEMLGEERDLANYARAVVEIRAGRAVDALDALDADVLQRRESLRHDSLALGERLFSEKPDVFARRFQAHWREWHCA